MINIMIQQMRIAILKGRENILFVLTHLAWETEWQTLEKQFSKFVRKTFRKTIKP